MVIDIFSTYTSSLNRLSTVSFKRIVQERLINVHKIAKQFKKRLKMFQGKFFMGGPYGKEKN